MARFVGGCLCGAVRYSSDAEPVFSGVCHCRDCQRFTGSAFSVVIAVPRESMTLAGAVTRFSSAGDSGKLVHRMFCPTCGAGVFDEADALPGVAMLAAGTLDDASQVRPAMHIYCARAQPWVSYPPDAVKFDLMPAPE